MCLTEIKRKVIERAHITSWQNLRPAEINVKSMKINCGICGEIKIMSVDRDDFAIVKFKIYLT
jgi:hypothetical protein